MTTKNAIKRLGRRKSSKFEAPASAEKAAPVTPNGLTKQAQLIELLRGDSGATTTELASALNWLPHTARAALTGQGVRLRPSLMGRASAANSALIGTAAPSREHTADLLRVSYLAPDIMTAIIDGRQPPRRHGPWSAAYPGRRHRLFIASG